jgi:hypothetical protein
VNSFEEPRITSHGSRATTVRVKRASPVPAHARAKVQRCSLGCSPLAIALIAMTFTACAPSSSSRPSVTPSAGNAPSITALVVNPSGAVACIAGGRVAVLEGNRWTALPTPASASSAAWRGGAWWLALPQTGLVLKATGTPESISFVERPALVTGRYVFTLEGDVYDYAKTKIGRVAKLPSTVLENGDATFALVGNVVYSLTQTLERRASLPNENYSLLPSSDGVEPVAGLAARADGFTYRIAGTVLIAVNTAAKETARVDLRVTASHIVASSGFVTVSFGANLSVFRAGSLESVYSAPCGGGA